MHFFFQNVHSWYLGHASSFGGHFVVLYNIWCHANAVLCINLFFSFLLIRYYWDEKWNNTMQREKKIVIRALNCNIYAFLAMYEWIKLSLIFCILFPPMNENELTRPEVHGIEKVRVSNYTQPQPYTDFEAIGKVNSTHFTWKTVL